MLVKFGLSLSESIDVTSRFIKNFVTGNTIIIKRRTKLDKRLNDPYPRLLKKIFICDANNKLIFKFSQKQLFWKEINFKIPTTLVIKDRDNPENATRHIILVCWKRLDFLRLQLNNLNRQVGSKDIHLHILNNNSSAKDKIEQIVYQDKNSRKFKITLRHYDNSHCCFERFYYIRDVLLVEYNVEYAIIIDDDQQFSNDWVENMWDKRREKRFLCWYGKVWKPGKYRYWRDSTIAYRDCLNNGQANICKFHYGGPGGSIIDCSICDPSSILWNFPDNMAENLNIYQLDDLWLSYIVRAKGWQIRRSYLPIIPLKSENNDKISLMSQLKVEKQRFLSFLIQNKKYL